MGICKNYYIKGGFILGRVWRLRRKYQIKKYYNYTKYKRLNKRNKER